MLALDAYCTVCERSVQQLMSQSHGEAPFIFKSMYGSFLHRKMWRQEGGWTESISVLSHEVLGHWEQRHAQIIQGAFGWLRGMADCPFQL